jgi:ArsR family transcriptional regulator
MAVPFHDLLKAAAEPTRLRILNLLRHCSLCVTDLQGVLGLPQSTVSRHLATLRHAGLVVGARRETRILYSLAPAHTPRFEALRTLLSQGCCGEETFRSDVARLQLVARERADSCVAERL